MLTRSGPYGAAFFVVNKSNYMYKNNINIKNG